MTKLYGKALAEALRTHDYEDFGAVDMTVTEDHKRLGTLVPLERDEQAAVIAWADSHPEAWVLYANVNGQYRPGQRPEPGMRPGIPDLFLPLPRGGAHGLFIELKRSNGKPSDVRDDQKFWIETLLNRGYWAVVCNGADEAIAEIECYLQGGK